MTAPTTLHCLGIVNRGEAAMRCVRAVKALRTQEGSDLRAVVLYTDVDRDAPFVRHADAAVRLAATTDEVGAYLDHEALLYALRTAGADAVWPGWGFVAEDPAFADRVIAAGMRFLGPCGAVMRAIGDKVAAKRLAERAGIAVAPWSGGVVTDENAAVRAGAALGYPLLVKAAAGGGGRGIRVVGDAASLPAAFRSAATEAQVAFGDGRLFLERKIRGARHVEVQIAADVHGHVLVLGARDCSVQRRHQKLIEETPPPGVPPEVIAGLAAASVRVARDAGYVGVGTVEFLVTADDAFFLEMNPRLQVEHGITEAVTGLDLVHLQIRIARDESLAGFAVRERGVAIEARVCAEDPDTGFLPAPGRIARFDPALGPGIRVDTGVAAGSIVPAVFDSLIAKVIATGATRPEARSRLVCALRDLDLVIEGGATNTGYLVELLESPELRAGGVDTGWLDRRSDARRGADAADALLGAAILAYQRRRRDARLNFFADTTNVSPTRAPASVGQEVDLSFDGDHYRLQVFALGSWRYRVRCDDGAVTAVLRESDQHLGRLELADGTRRLVFDATAAGLRLEIDGRPYRFGWETTGQVRAATPGVVTALHVASGDRVAAGQVLGLLEAMKMEVAFVAPVGGVVTQVRVGKGQRVAAGDALVAIEPAPTTAVGPGAVGADRGRKRTSDSRVTLADAPDPIAPLLLDRADATRAAGLAGVDALDARARQAAIAALRDELRSVLLGYDVASERVRALTAVLESPDLADLSPALQRDLAALRHEVVVYADIEQLFAGTPSVTATGQVGPSNASRLRAYVRRVRVGGAGIAEEFLAQLRTGLAHYGVTSLDSSDVLERALLRLFATQKDPDLRRHLVRAVLRCLAALARSGVVLEGDRELANALRRIAAVRSLVSDALADAAIEAVDVIFEHPAREHRAELAARRIAPWLSGSAAAETTVPPIDLLLDIAAAPRDVFDRVGRGVADADPRRRGIAVLAHLLRFYAAGPGIEVAIVPCDARAVQSLALPDGRLVVGAGCTADDAAGTVAEISHAIASGRVLSAGAGVHAVELIVTDDAGHDRDALVDAVRVALPAGFPAARCTLSFVDARAGDVHRTLVPRPVHEDPALLGMHPETASRVGLARLTSFALERLPGADNLYCFFGRSRVVADDERLFVLAEVRGRNAADVDDTAVHIAAFERVFHQAASALRALRGARAAHRRLHWNRITISLGPALALDTAVIQGIAGRLAPATRHLGLEKVVVRMRLHERAATSGCGDAVEVVVSDITGGHMEVTLRPPQVVPLEPASEYDRRVVEARRRRLVYPYEIVRMLTSRTGGGAVGLFEEYDLDPAARAVCVARRPHGENRAGVVFGILSTPTDKVPEGMRSVLVLSDPTRDMGALAAPESDRVIAALDLAAELRLPVTWIPISSGARIAMDSGTENLDATARVARRILTFTGAGGVVHLVVYGVNVGAQSYWNALATMLSGTRGALIMTPQAAMVLTGRAALEASGSVAAEDEVALGGFERIMGPNGEAQYYAGDLRAALRILEEHQRFTYVVPGESHPRRHATADPVTRDVTVFPYPAAYGHDFATVGEIFDDAKNPGRKRPFAMRAVMASLVDQDGGSLERWRSWAGAETAVVWDAHLGGVPIALVGIEASSVPRDGYRPLDGPPEWTAGTLFPSSSKKVSRALDAASGNRPVVILANLSGFDGSPESLRKLQLQYGAEIVRAVVHFEGPLFFVVVSRYHGGAYVVFSKSLNPRLRAFALTGSYASVIGGGPAATVIFTREVRARAGKDVTVSRYREALASTPTATARDDYERALADATRRAHAGVAAEFDAIHTVERACRVGSLDEVVTPQVLRPTLIRALRV
ncbi:MAG: biotin/lipoyl-binding protein [Deltaproteobacteria bacterium]|nr:biotin/lipoyl-binding protein [Deltaproteobacteria bacterium]